MTIDKYILIAFGFALGAISAYRIYRLFDRYRISKGEYVFFPIRSAYQATACSIIIAVCLGAVAYTISSIFLGGIAVGLVVVGPFVIEESKR
jgi:hypothetical protein